MRSVRKSLLGSLLRLAMVPLSLPCLCAAFCCCSVAMGSGEAQEEHLVLRLGGPQNAIENGVARDVGSDTLIAGTDRSPQPLLLLPGQLGCETAAGGPPLNEESHEVSACGSSCSSDRERPGWLNRR